MVKFTNVEFEKLGEFIRELIKDPSKQEVFRSNDQKQIKALLSGFMTPKGKTWKQITVVPHFDEELVAHIAFPFTGDVEETVDTIAPSDARPGEDYTFPAHYTLKPNAGATPDIKKKHRLQAYYSRLGDYVMSRCK